jgi:sigma-B regulation protein RsbU (phosphoserine phosphatase)
MKEAPRPDNEADRLQALRDYEILDTLPEQAYDDITYLASQICDTPMAAVSLVDENRQWFKSRRGLSITGSGRDVAFCAHAILDPHNLLIVEDTNTDERFADNPLARAEPPMRFYAGAPLVTSSGHALGTICVIDETPRQLSDAQQEALRALSRQVIAQLELRRTAAVLERHAKDLESSHHTLEQRNEQLNESRDELSRLVEVLRSQADVIERDLHRAEIIQRSLLPHDVPPMARFNVRTLYRPGRTIGGDLYDVVSIAERYLALVVADASGHGVSAAMLSVLFKHHMRLQDPATGLPYPPATALERINSSLVENPPAPGVFITAAIGLLDTHERTLVIGSAGHPPLLWLKADGSSEPLDHTGPALGLTPDAEFDELRLSLAEDDRVLFYTDGLLDICASAPTLADIAAVLREHRDDPEILEQLLLTVTGGQSRSDCDDVTMVLLDAAPGESSFNEYAQSIDLAPLPATERPTMAYGETPDASVLVLAGRVTWMSGQILFDTAMSVLDARRNLVIDLGGCEHVDSTVLGTLHELNQRALEAGLVLRIQNVSDDLRESFGELSMTAVLAAIPAEPLGLPEKLVQIDVSRRDLDRQQRRLLKAHEELADLSGDNREAFGSLLDALRAELRQAPAGPPPKG